MPDRARKPIPHEWILWIFVGILLLTGLLTMEWSYSTSGYSWSLFPVQFAGVLTILLGLHRCWRLEAYVEFHRTVDWSQRIGHGPTIPMSPRHVPKKNAVVTILVGLLFVGFPFLMA